MAGSNAGRAPIGAQTWDWHRELAGGWAVLEYPQARRPFVTLTEAGLLAKIGINSAGVGVLFNILSHRSDTGDGGVPVHAVARRILDSAGDVEAARRDPAQRTAGGLQLLHAAGRRPGGLPGGRTGRGGRAAAGPLERAHQPLPDPELAAGALPTDPDSDSLPRLDVLTDPDGRRAAGRGCRGAGRAAVRPRCRRRRRVLPRRGEPPLGSGWQTLATIALEPGRPPDERAGRRPVRPAERNWLRPFRLVR